MTTKRRFVFPDPLKARDFFLALEEIKIRRHGWNGNAVKVILESEEKQGIVDLLASQYDGVPEEAWSTSVS